jgi:hypothetical protein
MSIRLSSRVTNNSAYQQRGRYVQGGVIEKATNRLGWLEIRNFPRHNTDVRVTVRPEEEGRPDLLAYNVYGTTSLMWFILQYNNIIDITEEFISGKQLILPTQKRLTMDLLTKQTVK